MDGMQTPDALCADPHPVDFLTSSSEHMIYYNAKPFATSQLYVKEVLVGGVDEVSKLAEDGDLINSLANAAGVAPSKSKNTAGAVGGGKSVEERCKDIMKRCVRV